MNKHRKIDYYITISDVPSLNIIYDIEEEMNW